jgi:DNA-binding CsgD family transcriptional regulator
VTGSTIAVSLRRARLAMGSDTGTGREEYRQIRHGLAQLTAAQREPIVVAYYGGLTYQEISDALHIPPATVKSRIRDGLIRLRDRWFVPRTFELVRQCGMSGERIAWGLTSRGVRKAVAAAW